MSQRRNESAERLCTHDTCAQPGNWVKTKRGDDKTKRWYAAEPSDTAHRKCYHHGPGIDRPERARARYKAKPNVRIQRTIQRLKTLAVPVTEAVQGIHDELDTLGFPSSSTDERVSGGSTKAPSEADAIRVGQLTLDREELRDALDLLGTATDTIARITRRVNGVKPAAAHEALCGDKQMQLEGSRFWGDYGCPELPVTRNLCPKHYQAERRWRAANELPARGAAAAEEPNAA